MSTSDLTILQVICADTALNFTRNLVYEDSHSGHCNFILTLQGMRISCNLLTCVKIME
jgi:hypothetical protein